MAGFLSSVCFAQELPPTASPAAQEKVKENKEKKAEKKAAKAEKKAVKLQKKAMKAAKE